MNRRTSHILLCAIALLLTGSDAFAQFMPERRFIRKGNRDYEKGDFAESEIDYLRAKGKDSLSFAAGYNLGNAYYRQGRFEEAAAAFAKPAPLGITPVSAAHNFYNAGNALFHQRKLEEALESYKQSLRINPNDLEAKFNLAYVKKLLEKEKENKQDQNNQNNDDKDQDNKNNQQDQNQNQNQDQNQNNDRQQDQNDQNKNDNGDQQDNKNSGQEQDGGQQNQQTSGITKEEAEQMLQAIEMGDEKTKEKVDAQKGRAVGGSSRNW